MRKSKVLYLGLQNGATPPTLPKQLEWAWDGFFFLSRRLPWHSKFRLKKLGIFNKTERRLLKLKGLLSQISYRGRTLVINNLVASMLWHIFTALQPPDFILKKLQSIFIPRRVAEAGYCCHPGRPAVRPSAGRPSGRQHL